MDKGPLCIFIFVTREVCFLSEILLMIAIRLRSCWKIDPLFHS